YRPEGEDEVEIYDGDPDESGSGAIKIFGGFIVRVAQQLAQGPVITFDCDLKNFVHRLDYKLVNSTYEAMTAHDIIEDIVDNFSGPGITIENVEDDATAEIQSITFNNIAPSQAIQKIADILSKEWYVDFDGDIHFFSKFSEEAPFNLDDTGGKYIFDSLHIVEDFTQIRNSILVEGGEEKSTVEETEEFVGNGTQYTFPLTRKYTGISVEVGSASQTVGIANIDSFDDYDVLYDFNTRSLQFNPASPPADGEVIAVSGLYYFPIAVRFREGGSIGKYGERQVLIQEKDISSRTDAVARAAAEIAAYAEKISEGSFQTYESGLRAGQKITISSDLRGISKQFVIQRLSGRVVSPEKILWTAEIVSVKTYEVIDLLAQIIKGSRVEVDKDAVIQNAERVNRTILVGRTITVRAPEQVIRTLLVGRDILTYLNDPPVWVAGPYHPTSLADRHRPAFADRGAVAS
ncbi:MAG TPA: hypothetical protein PKG74_03130, partial [Candidatus Colwellbacteria bacterium]|nr:hypothetical protein [Candidatus Colwellbacteria bacterium]